MGPPLRQPGDGAGQLQAPLAGLAAGAGEPGKVGAQTIGAAFDLRHGGAQQDGAAHRLRQAHGLGDHRLRGMEGEALERHEHAHGLVAARRQAGAFAGFAARQAGQPGLQP